MHTFATSRIPTQTENCGEHVAHYSYIVLQRVPISEPKIRFIFGRRPRPGCRQTCPWMLGLPAPPSPAKNEWHSNHDRVVRKFNISVGNQRWWSGENSENQKFPMDLRMFPSYQIPSDKPVLICYPCHLLEVFDGSSWLHVIWPVWHCKLGRQGLCILSLGGGILISFLQNKYA